MDNGDVDNLAYFDTAFSEPQGGPGSSGGARAAANDQLKSISSHDNADSQPLSSVTHCHSTR